MDGLKWSFRTLTLIFVTDNFCAAVTDDSNLLSSNPLIQELSSRLSALEELSKRQQHRITELESHDLGQKKQDKLQQHRITELESRVLDQQKIITDMEAAVRNQQHEMETLTGSLTETKQAFQKLQNVLANKNENIQDTEIVEDNGESSTVANRILARRQQQAVTHVAFTAILAHTRTDLGHDQNIVFDHVETNIGNAYNPHHGVFIAPAAGTYVFYVNIFSYLDGRSWGRMMVNGVNKADVFAQGGADRSDQNSQMLIIRLNKGDDVAIQNYYAHDNVFGDANLWTSFSGFLLHPDAEVNTILG